MIFELSIGSNNQTKKLESAKAIEIIAKQFEGFSALKGLGYWQGQAEKTLFVKIETQNRAGIVELAKRLCVELSQQAVAVASKGRMEFISA
jgi:Holliday junction resolvasome RuvABC DNA-binding subunit